MEVTAKSVRAAVVRLCFVLVLVLSASAGRVEAQSQQEARASFEQGVEASRAQRWEEARSHFQRSLELLPKPSTLFNLALAEIKLGHGRDALTHLDAFEQAASRDEHAAMLERAKVLRPQAQALIENATAQAENRGSELVRNEDGLSESVRKDVVLGEESYARGRDREALAAFERAYRASKRPELLYNIGVVADRLREDARALSAYERFVGALPDAPEAAVAQVRAEALRTSLEERARAPVAEAPSSSVSEPRRDVAPAAPQQNLALPRTLITVGALIAVGAIGAGVGAIVQQKDLDECKDTIARDKAGEDVTPCTNLEELERDHKPELLRGIAIGAGALGVGLVVTGAVLLVRRKSAQAQAQARQVTPWFSAHAGGLQWTAQF